MQRQHPKKTLFQTELDWIENLSSVYDALVCLIPEDKRTLVQERFPNLICISEAECLTPYLASQTQDDKQKKEIHLFILDNPNQTLLNAAILTARENKYIYLVAESVAKGIELDYPSADLFKKIKRLLSENSQVLLPCLSIRIGAAPLNLIRYLSDKSVVILGKEATPDIASTLPLHVNYITLSNAEEDCVKAIPKHVLVVRLTNSSTLLAVQAIPEHIKQVTLLDANMDCVKAIPKHVLEIGLTNSSTLLAVQAIPEHIKQVSLIDANMDCVKAIPKHVSVVRLTNSSTFLAVQAIPEHTKRVSLRNANMDCVKAIPKHVLEIGLTSISTLLAVQAIPEHIKQVSLLDANMDCVKAIPKHVLGISLTSTSTLLAVQAIPEHIKQVILFGANMDCVKALPAHVQKVLVTKWAKPQSVQAIPSHIVVEIEEGYRGFVSHEILEALNQRELIQRHARRPVPLQGWTPPPPVKPFTLASAPSTYNGIDVMNLSSFPPNAPTLSSSQTFQRNLIGKPIVIPTQSQVWQNIPIPITTPFSTESTSIALGKRKREEDEKLNLPNKKNKTQLTASALQIKPVSVPEVIIEEDGYLEERNWNFAEVKPDPFSNFEEMEVDDPIVSPPKNNINTQSQSQTKSKNKAGKTKDPYADSPSVTEYNEAQFARVVRTIAEEPSGDCAAKNALFFKFLQTSIEPVPHTRERFNTRPARSNRNSMHYNDEEKEHEYQTFDEYSVIKKEKNALAAVTHSIVSSTSDHFPALTQEIVPQTPNGTLDLEAKSSQFRIDENIPEPSAHYTAINQTLKDIAKELPHQVAFGFLNIRRPLKLPYRLAAKTHQDKPLPGTIELECTEEKFSYRLLTTNGGLKAAKGDWKLLKLPDGFPKNQDDILKEYPVAFLDYLFKVTNKLGHTKNASVPKVDPGHQLCFFVWQGKIIYVDIHGYELAKQNYPHQTIPISNYLFSDLTQHYQFLSSLNKNKVPLENQFGDIVFYHVFRVLPAELEMQVKKEIEVLNDSSTNGSFSSGNTAFTGSSSSSSSSTTTVTTFAPTTTAQIAKRENINSSHTQNSTATHIAHHPNPNLNNGNLNKLGLFNENNDPQSQVGRTQIPFRKGQ